jgi:hypothetical protein
MKRPTRRFSFSALALLVLIAGCVTVNVYFPAAQVERTAEKIVDEVYQEKKAPPAQGPAEKPQSRNDRDLFRPSPAWPASGPPRRTRRKRRPSATRPSAA